MRHVFAVVLASLLVGCPEPGVEHPPGSDVTGQVDSGTATQDAEPSFDAAPVPDAPPLGDGVQTLAGGDECGDADGPRNIARFNNPVNVAVGPEGDLYVADFDNGLIRVVDPDGQVTTLTEQPDFRRPFGLAFAPNGTLYVQTDYDDLGASAQDGGAIWSVDTSTGAAAVVVRGICRPRGLLALPDGRLLLPDMLRHDIQVLDPATGEISALAGLQDNPGFADGRGTTARFNRPYDAVLDSDGTVLIADRDNHRIRRLTLDGEVTTVAGTGVEGSDDGSAQTATFAAPVALAMDDAGTLYVTDTGGYVVRALSAEGQVTTIAGSGVAGFADGDPPNARFYGLEGLDVKRDGRLLFVADGNRGTEEPFHRIRRVTLDP